MRYVASIPRAFRTPSRASKNVFRARSTKSWGTRSRPYSSHACAPPLSSKPAPRVFPHDPALRRSTGSDSTSAPWDHVSSHERGVDFFCSSIADVDGRFQFLRLPHLWPASVLFRVADSNRGIGHNLDHRSDTEERAHVYSQQTWMPISIRTTHGRLKLSGGKSDAQAQPMLTERGRPRKAVYQFDEKEKRGPSAAKCCEFFVVATQKKLFLEQNEARSRLRLQSARQSPRLRLRKRFAEEASVGPETVATKLLDVWRGSEGALKHELFRQWQPYMNAMSRTLCASFVQLEADFYWRLNLDLRFASLKGGMSRTMLVGEHNIMHKIPGRRRSKHHAKAMRFSAFAGSKRERPYKPGEIDDVDFICAIDFDKDYDRLRGFYMLPRALFDKYVVPVADPVQQVRGRGLWHMIYFPDASPRTSSARVKQAEYLPYYIDANSENRIGELQKLETLLNKHGRTHE
mmetsp:Transcript_20339/g.51355  ORF Transcript_20339/g.51355 Transcript_20339/m.51355 type:complete len:460 (-) Transcript_20339:66-1445(-)